MKYTPWLFTLNANAQGLVFMIMDVVYSFASKLKYRREIFELSDGGELALDWVVHPTDEANSASSQTVQRPIIVFVPGISGDSSILYCKSMAYTCLEKNFDMVVVNYRGMAQVPLKTAKVYNSADYKDLSEVIEYLYAEHCLTKTTDGKPDKQTRRLFGVGVSMGSSVLGIYAAELGEKSRLDACVGVGCHFDMNLAFAYLTTNLFGFYDYVIGIGLALSAAPIYEQYDRLVAKKHPELV